MTPSLLSPWSRLTVATRLGWGFGALLAAVLLVGAAGLLALSGAQREAAAVETRWQPRLQAAHELQVGAGQVAAQAQALSQALGLGSAPPSATATAATDGAQAASPLAVAQAVRLLVEQRGRTLELEVRLHEADWNPAGRAAVDAAIAAGSGVRAAIDELVRAATEPPSREAQVMALRQLAAVDAPWRQPLRRLAELTQVQRDLALREVAVSQGRARSWLAGLTGLCLMGGLVLAVALLRSVRRPVDAAWRLAERVAQRPDGERATPVRPAHGGHAPVDLTSPVAAAATSAASAPPVASPSPVGTPSTATSAKSAKPVSGTPAWLSTEPADGGLAATDGVNAGNAATSDWLDTVAGPEPTPMRTMPVSAEVLVHDAVRVAERGSEVVTKVVSNMEDISASSRKINEILATIDSIAFQTNILALNAAVQAARAGHAGQEGRGFGVVAGEVRGLAQRAASAAREIKGLIHASVEKAESGTRLVRDAGTTMDAIVSSVQSVTELVGQISHQAGEQQAETLAAADRSVQRLDHLTRQNAALVEHSASAADALRQQADRLEKVVGAFKLLQQTQEAAWTAHTAIHSARASSRGDTQPGGLDQLGHPAPKRPPADGEAGSGWEGF